MTKREQIAAKIMAELVARCDNASAEQLASDATNYADALIAHLKRTQTTEDSSAVEDHIGEANKMVPVPCEIPLHYPDGWIPHKPGNPMPCEGGSRNRIRLRNGVVTTTIYPEDLEWGEIPYHTDEEIIAWKPVD